ncbi:MAG: hypothetical protein JO036_06750 [Candidatus Eremiobacteraeota bacterium]|nr:hypothetical protein [Candidatus Eremiobacteraeota bacterium]
MTEPTEISCSCGHSFRLHDAHGCAAFLGAFPRTAHLKSYCACKKARLLESAWRHGPVVELHRARVRPVSSR